jgi:hypothetical protein
MTARPADGAPRCRFCAGPDLVVVLDLGRQPAADAFPRADDPLPDPTHPLRMLLCADCGLAQLGEDPTTPDEPRGVEPRALVEQARDAVSRVAAAGLLPAGAAVREFGSPHGGSWLPLLAEQGLPAAAPGATADVVLDCFGMMHSADQRAALAQRAAAVAPGGLLLLQFHTLAAITEHGQWNALRHGHFAYYSVPALLGMTGSAGLLPVDCWTFPLYGGTVLLALRRPAEESTSDGSEGPGPGRVRELSAAEAAAGVTDPARVGGLQQQASGGAAALREELLRRRRDGLTVYGYGAASRTAALLHVAGAGPDLVTAVADASPAKQGRTLPVSRIPVISPERLLAARPDRVVLFLPDLLAEVRAALPGIEDRGGRWVLLDPAPHPVAPADRRVQP